MHVETEITTSITGSPIMYMSRPPKTDVINYISNVIFVFDITLTDNCQCQSQFADTVSFGEIKGKTYNFTDKLLYILKIEDCTLSLFSLNFSPPAVHVVAVHVVFFNKCHYNY